MRATEQCGRDARTNGKFGLSDRGAVEILRLFFTPDEELYNKRIDEFFDHEVLNSNFWLYWRTMFAFENWHSALEMKLYLRRFIHHADPAVRADAFGPDLSEEAFLDFVLTALLALLVRQSPDCGALLAVIRRSVCRS